MHGASDLRRRRRLQSREIVVGQTCAYRVWTVNWRARISSVPRPDVQAIDFADVPAFLAKDAADDRLLSDVTAFRQKPFWRFPDGAHLCFDPAFLMDRLAERTQRCRSVRPQPRLPHGGSPFRSDLVLRAAEQGPDADAGPGALPWAMEQDEPTAAGESTGSSREWRPDVVPATCGDTQWSPTYSSRGRDPRRPLR
jgi:hypothetical protein